MSAPGAPGAAVEDEAPRVQVTALAATVPWAILGLGLSSPAMHLYIVLQAFAVSGEPPTRERLAALMGRSPASVGRYLTELAGAGCVSVHERRADHGGTLPSSFTVHASPRGQGAR